MRTLAACSLAVLAMVVSTNASAQLKVIASDGDSEPGVGRFNGVGGPSIGDDGSVAFPLANGTCSLALWSAGEFRCVAPYKGMMPGGGILTDLEGEVDHRSIPITGPWLAFTARIDGSRTSLFGWQSGTLKRLAGAAGDPAIRAVPITNKNGESLAIESTTGKIWLVSPTGAMSTLFAPGMPIPGLPGYVATTISRVPQLDDKGEVTMTVGASSTVTMDTRSVVLHGPPEKLVMDQPLGAPTDPWVAGDAYSNADGVIVYPITWTPKDADKSVTALWAGSPGATQKVLTFPVVVNTKTITAPAGPIVIARGGRFAFKGHVEGSGSALVAVDLGKPSLIVASGSPLAAKPTAKVHQIDNYAIGDNGDVYVGLKYAGLSDPSISGQGVFAVTALGTEKILDTDDVIDLGALNKQQRVMGVGFAQSFGAGYARALSSRGQLVMKMAFDGATLRMAVVTNQKADPAARLPDLKLTLSGEPEWRYVPETLESWKANRHSVEIRVANIGDADTDAFSLELTSTHPFSTYSSESSGIRCPEVSGVTTVRCSGSKLAFGSTLQLSLPISVKWDPLGPATFTGSVAMSGPEKDLANNKSTYTVTLIHEPEDSGGCTTGGRAPSSAWVLSLCAALLLRRRRR